MNTALYILANEYRQAAEYLADLDLDEQTVTDTLASLSGELTIKARNIAMCIRNLETTAEQIKAAEAQMAKRRKAIENRAARIKQYLLEHMRRAGIQKIDCPYFRIAIRNNPPAVQIDDEQHIPAQFMRAPEPPPPAPDKKAIIDVVYEGHAQIAVAPMPPLQWSYDQTLKDAPRDFKQAKKLLTQAGYPNGFTLSLWAMPVERPYNPNSRLMAEMIQADWKKIGVTAKIVTYEWAEYIKRAFNGEHDSMLIGSNENADPSNWLRYLSCRAVRTSNFSKWCHTSFDNLIQKAEKVSDMDQRISLYLKAQRIFKREQPFTPIAYSMIYQPLNKNVINFKISPFGTVSFSGVSLK